MITVAITGGIGSGKTAVTDYLESRGYIVIDADKMAREMTAPHGKAIPYIIENFGFGYIDENGAMDRAAMRDLVFRNPEKKALLEAGTTQVVLEDIEAIKKAEAEKGTGVLFFAIPLLYETGTQDDYDKVWVVDADYATRCRRVQARDNIDDNLIKLIMDSQASGEARLADCDEVVENNGSLEELYARVDEILASYGE